MDVIRDDPYFYSGNSEEYLWDIKGYFKNVDTLSRAPGWKFISLNSSPLTRCASKLLYVEAS
jgi:hypothetical protein